MSYRTVAIIQARMGSSRLPGKVLMHLAKKPVLEHVINRVGSATRLDEIIVATSCEPADQAIVDFCKHTGVNYVCGSESDVLKRYTRAAELTRADIVVRVTADCPFTSGAVLDRVIATRELSGADYASNTLRRTYPTGLDIECFTREALDLAAAHASFPEEREHVTPYIYAHHEFFRLVSVEYLVDWSWIRWTLDTKQDLQFLEAICDINPLVIDPNFDWLELAKLVKKTTYLQELNNISISCSGRLTSDIRLL